MEIHRHAVAGTLESSDALVEVEPYTEGLLIDIKSVVFEQFGDSIEQVIKEEAKALGINKAKIFINDRGALECTIRARVETALKRAAAEDAL